MSVAARVNSDTQLARLLQIGAVLEEVVEARAARHYQRVPEAERDTEVETLLEEAREESARHRERLETLVAALDAESTPIDRVESLVADQYAPPGDTDGILYDQLHGEETAYKFYDDLIEAIEESEARFSVDRARVLETLRELRDAEEAGVEEVTELMDRTDGGGR
jgi:ferritin-like protein